MTTDVNRCADWQWNVNAWSKQDSPAAAVNHYLAARHLSGGLNRAFAWLCYGQRHDPDALNAYDVCRAAGGDERLYLEVLRAHGDRPADIDEAAQHLEWQAHNHPLSLVRAAEAWRGAHDPDGGPVAAMFEVLSGQAHNGSACQLYRACFAAAPEAFAELVVDQVRRLAADEHRHPYLDGFGPSVTVLRDQVPPHPVGGLR